MKYTPFRFVFGLISLVLLSSTIGCEELTPFEPGPDQQLTLTSINSSGQIFQVFFEPEFSSDSARWIGINQAGEWQSMRWFVNGNTNPYEGPLNPTNGIYQIDDESIAVLNRENNVLTFVETATGRVSGEFLFSNPVIPCPSEGFANDPYMGFTAFGGFWVHTKQFYDFQPGNPRLNWRANQDWTFGGFGLSGTLKSGKYDPESDQFFFFQNVSYFFPNGSFGQAHLFDLRLANVPNDVNYGNWPHASNVIFDNFNGVFDTIYLTDVKGVWAHEGEFYGLDTRLSRIIKYTRSLPTQHSLIRGTVVGSYRKAIADTKLWQFKANEVVHILDDAQNWLQFNHGNSQAQLFPFPYVLEDVQASKQFWYCLTTDEKLYRFTPTTQESKEFDLGKWKQVSKINVRSNDFVLLSAREPGLPRYALILVNPNGDWVEVMTDLVNEPDIMIH